MGTGLPGDMSEKAGVAGRGDPVSVEEERGEQVSARRSKEVILFITRKFPPTKGGMEKAAYDLSKHLSSVADVRLVKWGGSNKWLPLILPYFFLKSLWLLTWRKASVVYLQDGLLAPLGLILKTLARKPVVITIHGLDITYENRLYQFVIPRCAERLDKVICVSDATKEACLRRGIQGERIAVIPNGISDDFYMEEGKQELRGRLSKELKVELDGKKILLSVGRLVERKGIHLFVENVMPVLTEKDRAYVYLIAGEGAFAPKIRNAIEERNLKDCVFMLGRVDDDTLKCLYNASDIFIMPNMPVEGDMEGFGLVALEASSCGLAVVASNLEGIKDAVKGGENGFLVEPCDTQGFVEIIEWLLADGRRRREFGTRAREFTLENYGWEKVARLYLEELRA